MQNAFTHGYVVILVRARGLARQMLCIDQRFRPLPHLLLQSAQLADKTASLDRIQRVVFV